MLDVRHKGCNKTVLTPENAMSLLVAQQIHHSYGGTQALCDVSLEIEPGEWHALCGENGAGKSTLIKIISGVEPPDHGSVTLD